MNRKIITYIAVSFGFSWAIALIVMALGGFSELGSYVIIPMLFYMCGPAIGALICAWLYEKGRRVSALGLSGPFTWYLPAAWATGVMILLVALWVSLLGPGISLADPIQSNIALLAEADLDEVTRETALKQLNMPFIGMILFVSALFIGPVVNWPLMLSEEMGWRGYLWDQLKPQGFWRISWITGLLWGIWHVPIILLGHNYPEMPLFGSLMFIVLCTLMGPIYSWIRLKSGSVWGPCLLHGTTNGAAAYFLLAQSSTDMPWKGLLGIGGFVALSFTVLLIWLLNRKTSLTISS